MEIKGLNVLECKALEALMDESGANGHDFGVMEYVPWEGDRRVLGGLVTQLYKKGYIAEVATPLKVNGGDTVTQYVLSSKAIVIAEAYEARKNGLL